MTVRKVLTASLSMSVPSGAPGVAALGFGALGLIGLLVFIPRGCGSS